MYSKKKPRLNSASAKARGYAHAKQGFSLCIFQKKNTQLRIIMMHFVPYAKLNNLIHPDLLETCVYLFTPVHTAVQPITKDRTRALVRITEPWRQLGAFVLS